MFFRRVECFLPCQLLVLDFTPVSNIDTTGLHALFELIKALGSTQVSYSSCEEC